MDMGFLDSQGLIDTAWNEARENLPPPAEVFHTLQDNIQKISVSLSMSEMSSSNLLAAAHSLSAKMMEAMMEHKKNMATASKVRAFEEYRKIVKKMKEAIDSRNESVKDQTELAAASAGFTEQDGKFVKISAKGGVAGIVDPYVFYDRDLVDTYLKDAGFDQSQMEGQELVNFLKDKSDVEVESFFYVQKLAVQVVMDRVFGKGNKLERDQDSGNTEVVGELGKWIGKAPNQGATNEAIRDAGGNADRARLLGSSGNTANLTSNYMMGAVASGGSGELGSPTARESGASLGFYVQLKLMGDFVEQGNQEFVEDYAEHAKTVHGEGNNSGSLDSYRSLTMKSSISDAFNADLEFQKAMYHSDYLPYKHVERLGYEVVQPAVKGFFGAVDELGGVFILINPEHYADMYYNVENANRNYGKKKGYMWEAQGIAMGKSTLHTAGTVAVTVGTAAMVFSAVGGAATAATGVGAALGGIGFTAGAITTAAGAAGIILADSTEVNTKTGERRTKMTDASAARSAAPLP